MTDHEIRCALSLGRQQALDDWPRFKPRGHRWENSDVLICDDDGIVVRHMYGSHRLDRWFWEYVKRNRPNVLNAYEGYSLDPLHPRTTCHGEIEVTPRDNTRVVVWPWHHAMWARPGYNPVNPVPNANIRVVTQDDVNIE